MSYISNKKLDIQLVGNIPGGLSALCALQSEFYAREWHFSFPYESVMSGGVSEFLSRYDECKDFVRLVLMARRVVGGIVIDHRDGIEGQLRWFYVSDELRGTGVGRRIFDEAMCFVKQRRFQTVFLNTFEGLDKARTFYEKAGFRLAHQKAATTWGTEVNEQKFVLNVTGQFAHR